MCGLPSESITTSTSTRLESLPKVSTDHIPLSYAANFKFPFPESKYAMAGHPVVGISTMEIKSPVSLESESSLLSSSSLCSGTARTSHELSLTSSSSSRDNSVVKGKSV